MFSNRRLNDILYFDIFFKIYVTSYGLSLIKLSIFLTF